MITVFRGPTTSRAEVLGIIPDAQCRPPIRHGDLHRLQACGGDTVVILDGVFYQSPSVRHQEILHYLDSGVRIIGAASMGALRAAELHDFGMEGYGHVFEALVNGDLVDDDEVAVSHGDSESDFAAFSIAMVSIREAVRSAALAGVLTAEHADSILNAAKPKFFPDRRWRGILRDAELPETVSTRFLQYVSARADIKRRDAIEALQQSAEPTTSISDTSARAGCVTQFREHYFLTEAQIPITGGSYRPLDLVRAVQLFYRHMPSLYERICLAGLSMALGGSPTSLSVIGDVIAAAERSGYPLSRLSTELRVADRAEVLLRTFREAPGVIPLRAVFDLARDLPGLEAARQLVGNGEPVAEAGTPFEGTNPRELLGRCWQTAVDDRTAQLRGFSSARAALKAFDDLAAVVRLDHAGAMRCIRELASEPGGALVMASPTATG